MDVKKDGVVVVNEYELHNMIAYRHFALDHGRIPVKKVVVVPQDNETGFGVEQIQRETNEVLQALDHLTGTFHTLFEWACDFGDGEYGNDRPMILWAKMPDGHWRPIHENASLALALRQHLPMRLIESGEVPVENLKLDQETVEPGNPMDWDFDPDEFVGQGDNQ